MGAKLCYIVSGHPATVSINIISNASRVAMQILQVSLRFHEMYVCTI